MGSRGKAWMPLYVGDFMADTRDLSTEEIGAYLLLLMHYWNTGPLTTDHARLANICGWSKYKFSKKSPIILRFFSEKSGKLFNERMDKEIAKAIDISKKRADAGHEGGVANATANAKHMPTQPQPQPHSTPIVVERMRGDYSKWKPEKDIIARIKASNPDITDTFIQSCISEFITYAEDNFRQKDLRAKFIASVNRQWKSQKLNQYRNNSASGKPDSERVQRMPVDKVMSLLKQNGIADVEGPIGLNHEQYRVWASRKLKERERVTA